MNEPSQKLDLNKTDLKKIGTDAMYFLAPAALLFVLTYQSTNNFKMASVALWAWLLNTAANMLRKFINGKPTQ